MTVASIVGGRPRFAKAATVCQALRQRHEEVLAIEVLARHGLSEGGFYLAIIHHASTRDRLELPPCVT